MTVTICGTLIFCNEGYYRSQVQINHCDPLVEFQMALDQDIRIVADSSSS